jgi:hypothetical protein
MKPSPFRESASPSLAKRVQISRAWSYRPPSALIRPSSKVAGGVCAIATPAHRTSAAAAPNTLIMGNTCRSGLTLSTPVEHERPWLNDRYLPPVVAGEPSNAVWSRRATTRAKLEVSDFCRASGNLEHEASRRTSPPWALHKIRPWSVGRISWGKTQPAAEKSTSHQSAYSGHFESDLKSATEGLTSTTTISPPLLRTMMPAQWPVRNLNSVRVS